MIGRLELDFSRTQARGGSAGWVVLAAALLLAWKCVDMYAVARHESDFLESRIDQLRSQAAGRADQAPGMPEATLREIRQANQVIEQISLPWERLFGAVEAAAGSGISLLGIAPDPRSATVEISGEAVDLAAMFDYVKTLERQGTLTRVYLLNHQVSEQDPDRPVRFTLSASWSAKSLHS